MKAQKVKARHHQLMLRADGFYRMRYVHQLVLEAFVGPCPSGLECRHLDGNPDNNQLENLRWGTRLENMADKKLHGTERPPAPRYGLDNFTAKFSDDDIRCIRAEPTFPGVNIMLAKCFGTDKTYISKIRNGHVRTGLHQP